MGAIITAVLPVLLNVLEQTPALVADVQKAWGLLTADTAPTADEQAAIDAALDAAHAALQNS